MVFTPVIRLIMVKFVTVVFKLFNGSKIGSRLAIVLVYVSNLFTWPLQLIDLLLITIRGKWDEVTETEPDLKDITEATKFVWNLDLNKDL